MNTQEAIDLVNSTTFRPGWKISARAYPYSWSPGDTRIEVHYRTETVDTSYPDASGRYTRRIELANKNVHDVEGKTGDQLLRAILNDVHRMDEHEDREFLRVRQGDGSWKAPFHPHTDEGDRKWSESGVYAPRQETVTRLLDRILAESSYRP
jgi:hypothetical protein